MASKWAPFRLAIRVRWKELQVQEPNLQSEPSGTPFRKKRWSDQMQYLVQVYQLFREPHAAKAATALGLQGIVRATTGRCGAFGKDKFDLSGFTAWSHRNVMSVSNITWPVAGVPRPEWGKPDELWAVIHFNRVKFHYQCVKPTFDSTVTLTLRVHRQ